MTAFGSGVMLDNDNKLALPFLRNIHSTEISQNSRKLPAVNKRDFIGIVFNNAVLHLNLSPAQLHVLLNGRVAAANARDTLLSTTMF